MFETSTIWKLKPLNFSFGLVFIEKMRGEYVELSCPFCDKGKIQAWYIPGVTRVIKRPTATFGKAKKRVKDQDIWIIKSGCNVCGKSQEEVEKELKKQNII
ncbi:MAG: hypothetical protein QW228_04205 [Candidatus Aenigmatarchaeota archaeon]